MPKPRRPLSREEVHERVARLSRADVPSRSTPEDLDEPLDPGIRLEANPPYTKMAYVAEDKEVSWLTVVDFEQQIGSATVRMGGIAGVHTHEDRRLQGYSRRLMEGSLRWMRREGFDTSMLYGIRGFYPKFGFAEAFPGVSFTLPVRDAETVEPSGAKLVDYRPSHLAAVVAMYHACNAGRTGPVRRGKAWRPFRKGLHFNTDAIPRVAVDAPRQGSAEGTRRRPLGYVVLDSTHLTATVIEVGFASTAVFPDLLRHAAAFALRQRLESIRLILPEDDAFVDYCKPLGLKEEVTFRRDGGGMVRLINVRAALAKAADELGPRMSRPGRLNLRTNLDDAGLAWAKGRLRVGEPQSGAPTARLPQWALAQLLYGYRSAVSLAASGALRASKQAIASLEEMFPQRPHFHYAVDHF